MPLAQVVTVFARTSQPWPQVPQLVRLVARLASQPSAAMPLQSPKPALQVKPHTPAPLHAGFVALAGVGQALAV